MESFRTIDSNFNSMRIQSFREMNHVASELIIKDRKFKRSDFICKFINLNRYHFKTFKLENVIFNDDDRDLTEYLKTTENLPIEVVGLTNCKLGNMCISHIMNDFSTLKKLQEVSLVNMNIGNCGEMKQIFESLQSQKQL